MLPTILDPILPVLSKDVPRGKEWLYEPKLDGFRGTLYLEGGAGSFRSKAKRMMSRFNRWPQCSHEKSPWQIVMGESGPDFDALFSSRGIASYAASDLLWLNGKDLRSLPLSRRKARLRKLVDSTSIGYVESVDDPALFKPQ